MALSLVAAGAATAFGILAFASARRLTAHADRKLSRKSAARPRGVVRRVAAATAPIGKWYVFVPVGLGVSAALAKRGRHPRRMSGAATVAGATILAALLEPAFDHVLPQPPVPRGRSKRNTAVFPSGHAFVPTAVLMTSAYVLSRQDETDARVVFPVAVALPALLAGAKVMTEKHWPSDVIAGWIAGIALTAGCVAAYEVDLER